MTRSKRPRQRGFTLIEVTIVMVVVSLLAAAGWWAYTNHRRKMRAADARKNVDRLVEASLAYYLADHGSLTEKSVTRRFPPPAPDTPGVDVCCHQPEHRCDPQKFADAWKAETWKDLDFSLQMPFYHWYRYDSKGVDKNAEFTVSAGGNLDCDETYASFRRGGHVDEGGNPVADPAISVENEFE
jgi:prepilin-type N-terminal cleavage/methylation domain-containing protein